MAATPTVMPWRPAARRDARQAASFDASRANNSFKMDIEEVIAVIAYVRLRKQKLKKKQIVGASFRSRPSYKIYSDLRKYPDKFFSYLRLSIGSFHELLTM
jgi:hypothetical protein